MDRKKLEAIGTEILKYPLEEKERSEDFAGVYVATSAKPISLKDVLPPIHSFRAFSDKHYPLYFFLSENVITEDFDWLYQNYGDIRVKIIPRMNNIWDFNNFAINQQMYYIDEKHENLMMIAEDGYLLRSGWEKITNGYSYLGPAWKDPIKVLENIFNFGPVQIGNGGVSFRRRSKCIEVLEFVNRYGGQANIVKGMSILEDPPRGYFGHHINEDLFFSYFGFGAGIFEQVPIDFIREVMVEPITFKEFKEGKKYAFHKIDE